MDSEQASQTERGVSERALQTAITVYAQWRDRDDGQPLDRQIESTFRARRDLNSGERRWIAETVYGSVRFLRRQQSLCAALDLPDTPETLIRLWAAAPGDDSPVSGFRHTPPLVSPDALQAALASLPTPDRPHDYLRVTLSYPEEMAAELESLLGDEAVAAGQAFNAQAPTTLRVNTLRASRERLLKDRRFLDAVGEAQPTRYSPWGIELARRVNVQSLPGFREGRFEVQEEGSQIIAQLAAPQPGQSVADVGAGAGGKTLALAAMMEDRGRLLALDSSAERLKELERRIERAKVTSIQSCRISVDTAGNWQPAGETLRTIRKWWNAADCVLLDAPCTGSGVLRRSPDTKWRETDVTPFTRLQAMLLKEASMLVAPGGVLCYATCAFERAQNEDVIAAFLASSVGTPFTIEPISSLHPSLHQGPFLRTWPHRHGLDAFFAARLRRA